MSSISKLNLEFLNNKLFSVEISYKSDYASSSAEEWSPHIHVQYGEEEAVISIPDGDLIEGSIRANKLKLVQAWIEIHQEDLMADWQLAVNGQQVFKINPLR